MLAGGAHLSDCITDVATMWARDGNEAGNLGVVPSDNKFLASAHSIDEFGQLVLGLCQRNGHTEGTHRSLWK